MAGDSIREDLTRNTSGSPTERLTHAFFFICAVLSVLTTVGIVVALATDAAKFFRATGPLLGVPVEETVPAVDFFTGTRWSPTNKGAAGEFGFGVLELVADTLVVTVGSAAIALPLGLLTAIYLSEYATT